VNIFGPMRKEIEQRFEAAWIPPLPPVYFENAPGIQDANHLRLTIRGAGGEQKSMGGVGTRLERQTGVVAIQIFITKKTGTGVARGHADTAANIFRSLNFTANGLAFRFFTPTIKDMPDDKSYFSLMVVCPFEVDGMF
jgi:hypothetical protein